MEVISLVKEIHQQGIYMDMKPSMLPPYGGKMPLEIFSLLHYLLFDDAQHTTPAP
jgi:hypothetical protein